MWIMNVGWPITVGFVLRMQGDSAAPHRVSTARWPGSRASGLPENRIVVQRTQGTRLAAGVDLR